MSTIPKLLTVAEFCAAMKISRKQAYSLIRSGRVRAVRITQGGAWRIFEDSVLSLLGLSAPRPKSAQVARRQQSVMERLGV